MTNGLRFLLEILQIFHRQRLFEDTKAEKNLFHMEFLYLDFDSDLG